MPKRRITVQEYNEWLIDQAAELHVGGFRKTNVRQNLREAVERGR